jgi:hypothetical protein
MAGSEFRPAPQVNSAELEKGLGAAAGRTREDSTHSSNVGLPRPSKETHDNERETTDINAESLDFVDADDIRMRAQRGQPPIAEGGHWKLTPQGTRVGRYRRWSVCFWHSR